VHDSHVTKRSTEICFDSLINWFSINWLTPTCASCASHQVYASVRDSRCDILTGSRGCLARQQSHTTDDLHTLSLIHSHLSADKQHTALINATSQMCYMLGNQLKHPNIVFLITFVCQAFRKQQTLVSLNKWIIHLDCFTIVLVMLFAPVFILLLRILF